MKKNKNKILYLTYSAMIAVLYIILSWISEIFGLAYLVPQIRLGEALCVLAYFTPSAIPGLFIGCILSNLSMGCAPFDIIFGSLATLLGVFFGRKLRRCSWLVPIPTVLSNTLIIPFIIIYCYMDIANLNIYLTTAFTVFIGEVASAYVIGMILLFALKKRNIKFRV